MQLLEILLYSQISDIGSLRELGSLDIFRGEVNLLRWRYIPCRTPIAYANEHRVWRVFQKIYEEMVRFVQPVCRDAKYGKPDMNFKFDNTLLIQPSCSCATWCSNGQTTGRPKVVFKIHTMLNNNTFLPVFVYLTKAKKYDQKVLVTIDPVDRLLALAQ